MTDGADWKCSGCGNFIDGPETRTCPNCGGINFSPLVDEIIGQEWRSVVTVVDVDRELERLPNDDES